MASAAPGGGYSELIGQVSAGKLRALAVTAETPVSAGTTKETVQA